MSPPPPNQRPPADGKKPAEGTFDPDKVSSDRAVATLVEIRQIPISEFPDIPQVP